MKNFYDTHVLPHVIDLACGLPPFESGRIGLLAEASGRRRKSAWAQGAICRITSPRNWPVCAGLIPRCIAKPHSALRSPG